MDLDRFDPLASPSNALDYSSLSPEELEKLIDHVYSAQLSSQCEAAIIGKVSLFVFLQFSIEFDQIEKNWRGNWRQFLFLRYHFTFTNTKFSFSPNSQMAIDGGRGCGHCGGAAVQIPAFRRIGHQPGRHCRCGGRPRSSASPLHPLDPARRSRRLQRYPAQRRRAPRGQRTQTARSQPRWSGFHSQRSSAVCADGLRPPPDPLAAHPTAFTANRCHTRSSGLCL